MLTNTCSRCAPRVLRLSACWRCEGWRGWLGRLSPPNALARPCVPWGGGGRWAARDMWIHLFPGRPARKRRRRRWRSGGRSRSGEDFFRIKSKELRKIGHDRGSQGSDSDESLCGLRDLQDQIRFANGRSVPTLFARTRCRRSPRPRKRSGSNVCFLYHLFDSSIQFYQILHSSITFVSHVLIPPSNCYQFFDRLSNLWFV